MTTAGRARGESAKRNAGSSEERDERGGREEGRTVYADGLVAGFDGVPVRGCEREGEAEGGQEEAGGAGEGRGEDGVEEEGLKREWDEEGQAVVRGSG